ncbi:MAG TPA: CDGSH iron-sulfur domain-containing protein [Myxococcaceae bacterium]|nr:CDGSH iron-sulfur domain-containing protein [Myxococcaceae bacterium]
MPRTRKIAVSKNGPYLVEGEVPLANQHIVTDEKGESVDWREGRSFPTSAKYALCRCGHSKTKPFCDGTHARIGFDGTETASREPYAKQAERIEGPTMVLDDAEKLCAFARFCDPHGQVWNLVQESGSRAAALVEQEAGHCPSGRLVASHRASREPIEPHFEPSIGLVQDTAKKVSGPLWVRGGIAVIGADGHAYEVRNRVTLCRCGASSNKPFCDGSHAAIGFDDQK